MGVLGHGVGLPLWAGWSWGEHGPGVPGPP